MNINPSALSTLLYIATGFGAAFMVALWIGLIIWTWRDIKSRSRDRLARILAVLVVGVLFLPGVLIYTLLRPVRTIEEEYQHTLEEEALLQSIEDDPVCPGCGRKVDKDWIVCANCHTRLKKPCHHCKRMLDLTWNLCPYCATSAPGTRKEKISMEEAMQELNTHEISVDEENPA